MRRVLNILTREVGAKNIKVSHYPWDFLRIAVKIINLQHLEEVKQELKDHCGVTGAGQETSGASLRSTVFSNECFCKRPISLLQKTGTTLLRGLGENSFKKVAQFLFSKE